MLPTKHLKIQTKAGDFRNNRLNLLHVLSLLNKRPTTTATFHTSIRWQ